MSEQPIRYEGTVLAEVPAIESIVILASTTSIKGNNEKDYAFIKATNSIVNVSFEPNPKIESISPYCFYNCFKLANIQIFQCSVLKSISEYAFYGCTALKSIQLSPSIETIGEYSFYKTGLLSVLVPKNVISIGDYGFACCYSMVSFQFEEGSQIQQIVSHLVTNCRITNFTVPQYARSWGTGVLDVVTTITSIYVHQDNQYFKSDNQTLFNFAKTKLIYHCSGLTGEYTIPDGVTTLGSTAFSPSRHSKIIFNDDITTIESYCFNWAQVSEVVLKNPLRNIYVYAFSGCTQLKSIILPNSVTQIGDSCFSY